MAAEAADGSVEVCWVCLDSSGTLIAPCACPRQAHPHCLARWQLQNAGKHEETRCRFCQLELPRWQELLPEHSTSTSEPAMIGIVLNGRTIRMQVPTGPDAEAKLRRRLARLCGRDDDGADLDVSFVFAAPTDGSKLRLSGMQAFGAALHCASLSAGRRKSSAAFSSPGASTDSVPGLHENSHAGHYSPAMPSSSSSLAAHILVPYSAGSVSSAPTSMRVASGARQQLQENATAPTHHLPDQSASPALQPQPLQARHSSLPPTSSTQSLSQPSQPEAVPRSSVESSAWLQSLRRLPQLLARKSQSQLPRVRSSQPTPNTTPAGSLELMASLAATLEQPPVPHRQHVVMAHQRAAITATGHHTASNGLIVDVAASQAPQSSVRSEDVIMHPHHGAASALTAAPRRARMRTQQPASTRVAQLEALVSAHTSADLTADGADPVGALLRARRAGAAAAAMGSSPPGVAVPMAGNRLADMVSQAPQSAHVPQQGHTATLSAASWSAGHPDRQGRPRAPTCPCCSNWDPWEDVVSADAVMVSRTRTLTPPPAPHTSGNQGTAMSAWMPISALSDTAAMRGGMGPPATGTYGWGQALTASSAVTPAQLSPHGSSSTQGYGGPQPTALHNTPSLRHTPPGSIAAAAWGSTQSGGARAMAAAAHAYGLGLFNSTSTVGTSNSVNTTASMTTISSTPRSDTTVVAHLSLLPLAAGPSTPAPGAGAPPPPPPPAAPPSSSGKADTTSAVTAEQSAAALDQEQEVGTPIEVLPLALPATSIVLPVQAPAARAQLEQQLQPLLEQDDGPGPDSLYAVPQAAMSHTATISAPLGQWHRSYRSVLGGQHRGRRLSPVPSRDASAHGASTHGPSVHGPNSNSTHATATIALAVGSPGRTLTSAASRATSLPASSVAPTRALSDAATTTTIQACGAARTASATLPAPAATRATRTLSAQSVGSTIARILSLVSGGSEPGAGPSPTEAVGGEGGSNGSRGSGATAAPAPPSSSRLTSAHIGVVGPSSGSVLVPEASPSTSGPRNARSRWDALVGGSHAGSGSWDEVLQQPSLQQPAHGSAPSSWRMLGSMAACFRGGALPVESGAEDVAGAGEEVQDMVGEGWEGPRSNPGVRMSARVHINK